jgi:hypothetical protein
MGRVDRLSRQASRSPPSSDALPSTAGPVSSSPTTRIHSERPDDLLTFHLAQRARCGSRTSRPWEACLFSARPISDRREGTRF